MGKKPTELAMWMNCETIILILKMGSQKVIHRISPEKWHDGVIFLNICGLNIMLQGISRLYLSDVIFLSCASLKSVQKYIEDQK